MLKLENEKVKVINSTKQEREMLNQNFSQLKRALKKFAHVALENNKLIEDYSDNPSNALEKDMGLDILVILGRIKENIELQKLDVKNPEKVLGLIKSLSREYFEGYQKKLSTLKEKKLEIGRKIQLSSANREFDEMNYKLKHMDERLIRHENDINETKKKIEKQNTDDIQVELEDNLSDLLKKNVKIVYKEDNENQ